MTQRIALLLAVAVYAASLSGCGCCRRVRDTLCRGAYCGSRTPVLGSVRAPAPAPVVAPQPQPQQQPLVSVPQFIRPQFIRPQVAAPPCQPCCPPCPTVVCDPCCDAYGSFESSGDCCYDTPYGINVESGEYLGEVQPGGSEWESASPTEADPQDPGPAE